MGKFLRLLPIKSQLDADPICVIMYVDDGNAQFPDNVDTLAHA